MGYSKEGIMDDFMKDLICISSAVFSPCRKYRYSLWRGWAEDWQTNYCMFICLNPSTADETLNDPTVRRCIRFSHEWGYSGFCMTNIFAYRATDPKEMLAVDDPVGEENDKFLAEIAAKAGVVVAAWGNHGIHQGRHDQVMQLVPNLKCLKVTKQGMPGHPLYLRGELKPVAFLRDRHP